MRRPSRSILGASPLQSGTYSEEYGSRMALGVQGRSRPLFVPDSASVRSVAQLMLREGRTAAVVHKADDTRMALFGIVTLSDM